MEEEKEKCNHILCMFPHWMNGVVYYKHRVCLICGKVVEFV